MYPKPSNTCDNIDFLQIENKDSTRMQEKLKPSLILKVISIIALLISIVISLSVLIWSKNSEYCLVDFVDEQASSRQVISILEDNGIPHKYRSTSSSLSISLENWLDSIEIIGPDVIEVSNKSAMACRYYLKQQTNTLDSGELRFWEHPKYFSLIKLLFGVIVIGLITLMIIRPLLRFFLAISGKDNSEAIDVVMPFNVGEVIVTPIWFRVLGTVFWSFMYLITLTITQISSILERYDTPILAISVVLPLLCFYQIFNGLMSVQFYGAKLVFTKDGFTVESSTERKRVLWSNITKVRTVEMSSVLHIYDRSGERVYSIGTDLSDTNRLIETLKLKTNLI